MRRLLLLINIFLLVFIIGSCATQQVNLIKTTDNLPYFNSVLNNISPQYDSTIRLINDKGQFYCTGFVVDGIYALTARHCVIDFLGNLTEENINIYSSQGSYTGVVAKAVAADGYRDVAFIQGDFKNFVPQKTDFYGEHVSRGFTMMSCGFPSGMLPKFCTELVHAGNRNFQFRTNGGPIFKGMSGGPVVNITTGYAIGVNSAVDEYNVIIGPLVGVLESVGLR